MKKVIKHRFPKLFAISKLFFSPPRKGLHYPTEGSAPPLPIFRGSVIELLHHWILERFEAGSVDSAESRAFLDIGGDVNNSRIRDLAHGFRHDILDLAPPEPSERVHCGDICCCPEVPDVSYDIVFSDNVLEHVLEPWRAFKEMGRILKPGGLCLHRTLFSWYYHPWPVDCWRYTHTTLEHMGQKYGGLTTLQTGYGIGNRRCNEAGGFAPGGGDIVPVDGYGGWLESWTVFYVGEKPRTFRENEHLREKTDPHNPPVEGEP